MDKKRTMGRWSIAFGVLIVLVVALVLGNGVTRSTTITLPPSTLEEDAGDSNQDNVIVPIAVTVDTVQSVIDSLERSENYRCTVRMEQLWSGGSGLREVTVAQQGEMQRLDELLPDGRTQHTITTGDTVYLWYDEDEEIYQGNRGDITPDETLGIPTYESVLELDVADIATATFDALGGLRCIQVETALDDQGYEQRFWVSVDSGLLVAAERLHQGTSIYRMAMVSQEPLTVPATDFILPDGRVIGD